MLSCFRGWVRIKVLGYGFGVRGKKVKSRDCALASDLVRAESILCYFELNFAIEIDFVTKYISNVLICISI